MFRRKSKAELWVECGDDYYYGRGGEAVDYETASNFYFKAMKRKHPRGTYMLGLCYELGRGVERDLEYADLLYADAAERGDTDAGERLAASGATEEERSLRRLLKELPQPSAGEVYTAGELELALTAKRKRENGEQGDHIALALALLLVKARFGIAVLSHAEALFAYLAEYLPKLWEQRRLAALVFESGAIDSLPADPQNAAAILREQGLSWQESGRLVDCFMAAFTVNVDSGLNNG